MRRAQSRSARTETMLSSAGAVQHMNASASLKPADEEVGFSNMYADTQAGWCDQHLHSRHSNCEQHLLGSSSELLSVTQAAAEHHTHAVQQQQLLPPSCTEKQLGWSADIESSVSTNTSFSSTIIIQHKFQGAAAGCGPGPGYSLQPWTAKQTTAQQMPQQQQQQRQQANTAHHSSYMPAADVPSKLSGTASQQSDPGWQTEQLQIKDQLLACLMDEKQQLLNCLMRVSAEVLAANADTKNALRELQGQLQELQHCKAQQQQPKAPADSRKVDTGLITAGGAAGVVVDATGVVSAGLETAGVAGTGPRTANAVDAALAAAAAALTLLGVTTSEPATAGVQAHLAGEQPDCSSLSQQHPRATGVTGSHPAEGTMCQFAGTAAVATPVGPDSSLACCTNAVAGSVPPARAATVVGSSTGSQQQQQRALKLQPIAAVPPATAATATAMPAVASSKQESGALCSSAVVEQLVDKDSSTDSTEQDSSSCLFGTPDADNYARSVAAQALQTQPPQQQQQHQTKKIDIITCARQQEEPATRARFAKQLQPLQLPQQQQQHSQLQLLPCTPLVTPAGGGAAFSGSSSWAHRSPAPPPKHAAEKPAAARHRPPRRHRSYSFVQQFRMATATAAAPDAGVGAIAADEAAAQAEADAAAVPPGRPRPTGRMLDFDSAVGTALPGCRDHLPPADPRHPTNSNSNGVVVHFANSSSSGCSRRQPDHALETMSCSMPRSLSHSQIPWMDTLGPTTADSHSSMQVTQQQQQILKSPSPVRQPTPPGQPPTHGLHFALLSPKLAGPHVRLTCPPNSPAPGSALAAAAGAGGTGASRCSGCKFLPAPPSDALPHDAYSSADIRFVAHRRRSCTSLSGLPSEGSDLDLARRLLSARCATKTSNWGDSRIGQETSAQEFSYRTAGHSLDGGALSSRGRITMPASLQVNGGGAAAFAAAMAAVAAKLQPEQV